MLLQKNIQGHEQSIVFFSCVLRDNELKYKIMEKHAYALVKSLKAFFFVGKYRTSFYSHNENFTEDFPQSVGNQTGHTCPKYHKSALPNMGNQSSFFIQNNQTKLG